MGDEDMTRKEDEPEFKESPPAEEGTPCRYRMSFRIRHPKIDPAEVTRTLSMAPSRAWRAGEPRTTPTGQTLGGLREESYWATGVRPSAGKDSDPEKDAVSFLDMLDPHAALLHDIVASGGRLEFFLTFWQGGTTFSARCLERLAAYGIDLSINS